MSFVLTPKRIESMRQSLGEACQFIDDERFFPMFRNRQLNYPREFALSIKLAKRLKSGGNRYFAKIWGAKSLKKTTKWLNEMVNKAISAAAHKRHQLEIQRRIARAQQGANPSLREKYLQIIGEHSFTFKRRV